MEPTTSAPTAVQSCPRCGATLDLSGTPVGAWLACPDCAAPVQVRPRPVIRPTPHAAEAPASLAWADDPRFAPDPRPPAKPRFGPDPPFADDPRFAPDPLPPPRHRVRKAGILPILGLAALAGTALVMFVGTYLGPQGHVELGITWLFGAALSLFVSALTRSIR